MVKTVGRLKDGELLISGEINERSPSIKNGLAAHYPFDGTTRMANLNLLKNSSIEKTSVNEFLQYADTAPIFDEYGLVTYTISFDIKSPVAGSVQVYQQNGSSAKYSFGANVNVTTEYTRQYVTVTPSIGTPTDTLSMLAFYGTYGTGRIATVKNVKVELGDHPTNWCPHFDESDTAVVTDCTLTNDGVAVEEGTTNLWVTAGKPGVLSNGGAFAEEVDSYRVGAPVHSAKTWKLTKTGSANQWHGWESAYNTGSYAVGDWLSVSGYYKSSTNVGVTEFSLGLYRQNWTGPISTVDTSPIVYDGEWHHFELSVQVTEAITNPIIADGPSWNYSTNAGIMFINGLQWEKKSFATSYVDGSRGHGEFKTTINLSTNYTLHSKTKDKFGDWQYHTLTKDGNNFNYYINGILSENYKNKVTEYRGRLDSVYPTFDNGGNPFKYGFFEKRYVDAGNSGAWDFQNWGASGWGGYFKLHLYCDSDCTINQNWVADNNGYFRVNYDNSTIKSIQWNTSEVNNISFDFKSGWNILEIVWSDGDSGGDLLYKSGSDVFTNHPNIKYVTAEMPINIVRDSIWINRYSNLEIKDLSIYNRSLSGEEVKKLVNRTFSINGNGNIYSSKIVEKPNGIPSDAIHIPLDSSSSDRMGLIAVSEEVDTVYENSSVWVGSATANLIPNPLGMDASNWTARENVTVTYGETDPFGGKNAVRIHPNTTSDNYFGSRADVLGIGNYSCSVWLKGNVNGKVIPVIVGTAPSPEYHIRKDVVLTTEWQKVEFSGSTTADPLHIFHIGAWNTWTDNTFDVWVAFPQVTAKPFVSPFTELSRGYSSLEFNLNRDYGLDWSGGWTIIYWKKAIGTHTDNLNGYNIESIGSNSNTVGGGYTWIGKENGANTNARPSFAFSPNEYFGHWQMVCLTRRGGSNFYMNFNHLGVYKVEEVISITNSNYYVTQHGYDLKLGGWDNGNPNNTHFRNLIVVKRSLTDAEIEAIYRTQMSSKNGKLYIQNKIKEKYI